MNDNGTWKLFTTVLLVILFIFIVCAIIMHFKTSTTTSSVENTRIDSITKENNKLIIEIKYLDSIKNEKVIEVKSLDNDSTLRLFYQLIGK